MKESNKNSSNFGYVVIIAAVSAGIALRINGVFLPGIWYDESLPFAAARLPFLSMLEATKFTYAPPLWGVIVWLSVRVFGQNEVALRLPALVASIFTIWLVYKISGEFLLSSFQKSALMVFVCILPYQIWTAQDGRIYALFSALYLGAAWFAIRGRWWGLTACSGLILYSHYAGPFYVLGLYAAANLTSRLSLRNLKAIIASGFVAVLSFIPWIPVYIATLGEDFTVAPLTASNLFIMFYRIMFADALGQSSLAVFGLFTISVCISLSAVAMFPQIYRIIKDKLFAPKQEVRNTEILYIQLSLMALFPLVIMLIWSILWKNFIYYRLLIPLAIPLIIWFVYTLTSYLPAWLEKYIFTPMWLILLIVGIANWSPMSRDGDLHHIIDNINKQWQPGDVIYHITGTSYMPFSNYLGDKPMYLINEQQNGGLLPTQLQDIFDVKRVALEAIDYKRVWIIYSRDELVSEKARERAERYLENGTLIGVVEAWQFAPIEIYLVNNKP